MAPTVLKLKTNLTEICCFRQYHNNCHTNSNALKPVRSDIWLRSLPKRILALTSLRKR